jgi:hypothetical protein
VNPLNPSEDIFFALVGISTLLAIINLVLLIICLVQKRMSGLQFGLTLAIGILGAPIIGLILSFQYEGLAGLTMMFLGSFYGFGILMAVVFLICLILLFKKKPTGQIEKSADKTESLDAFEID